MGRPEWLAVESYVYFRKRAAKRRPVRNSADDARVEIDAAALWLVSEAKAAGLRQRYADLGRIFAAMSGLRQSPWPVAKAIAEAGADLVAFLNTDQVEPSNPAHTAFLMDPIRDALARARGALAEPAAHEGGGPSHG